MPTASAVRWSTRWAMRCRTCSTLSSPPAHRWRRRRVPPVALRRCMPPDGVRARNVAPRRHRTARHASSVGMSTEVDVSTAAAPSVSGSDGRAGRRLWSSTHRAVRAGSPGRCAAVGEGADCGATYVRSAVSAATGADTGPDELSDRLVAGLSRVRGGGVPARQRHVHGHAHPRRCGSAPAPPQP